MFNGTVIPHADKSFDTVIFIDVLHHTNDPMLLLKEAIRVARKCIIIKDHNREGFAADPLLRLMDWMGNAPNGVALPYNYWSPQQWRTAFDQLNLTILAYRSKLGLYPAPVCWIFERSLHFVARLDLAHAPR
jgi:SAM-dependent methyltransferase